LSHVVVVVVVVYTLAYTYRSASHINQYETNNEKKKQMPALAYGIGRLLHLDETLAAGLILVSCINGAQASNLCTYIGHGDLALSILMTTTTTIGAILMTPLVIQWWLGGQTIPVNGLAMAMSTCQVVLVPILLGMGINAKFPKLVQQILPFSPTLGVAITCLLVGTSVAGCAGAIASAGASLQLSAFLLHAVGGLIGYGITRPFYSAKIARTFAIQLSMKSSAFGYLLATLHFGAAYAVPSAVSIVWMTVIGSTLAVVSRLFPPSSSPAAVDPNDTSVLATARA
jgi:bile acid:Na+ symporter, BASS family